MFEVFKKNTDIKRLSDDKHNFDFRSEVTDVILVILNNAKEGIIPSENELELLKRCFNHSLVGTSKFLHFINPSFFAIWDSRVFRYLTNTEPYQYRIDDYESYFEYLKFCAYMTDKPEYSAIHDFVKEKVGYEMTKFRTLELIFYFNGKRSIEQYKK